MEKQKIDLPVLPLRINEYTWTSGLNVGVALLNEIANQKNIDKENIKFMGMSFDVEMEDEEIQKMRNLSEKNRFILTIRKTTEETLPFGIDKEELWGKLKHILRKPLESDLFELCYSMRNTLSLIKLSDLVDFGGFNPLCDGKKRGDFLIEGGMEDSEFFLKIILNALKQGKKSAMRDFKKAMENVVTYSDPSWRRATEPKKYRKISNEVKSLVKIANGETQKMIVEDFNF